MILMVLKLVFKNMKKLLPLSSITLKIFVATFLLTIYCSLLQSQNLVPNPSFEEYTNCPTGTNEVPYCVNWYNFGNSPDYINTCSSSGIPYNFGFGFQYAHSGNAMIGIGTYVWQYAPDWPNYREFVGTQLSLPLEIGHKYFMSFFVNCAGYLPGWQIIATNKIGLRFSTIPYSECCPPSLTNWAHLYTDSIIIDTLNWIKISGSIIADSTYQYFIIGNFFDDNHTDITFFGGQPFGGSGAYYYIDDVCVSPDSIYNENWTGIKNFINKKYKIYPNPIMNELNIEQDENSEIEITIFDSLGRIILFEKKNKNLEKITLNLITIPNGFYTISIKNKNSNFNQSIIINH